MLGVRVPALPVPLFCSLPSVWNAKKEAEVAVGVKLVLWCAWHNKLRRPFFMGFTSET